MFELGKKDDTARPADRGRGADHATSAPSAPSTRAVSEPARGDVAVIGRSIRIDGDLQGDEDLRIDGDVSGVIRLHNNTLTIGSEGKIRADVFAKSVIVDGRMEGDLFGSERVSIRANATVLGNITSPRVSLDDGARFKGSIEMDPEAVQAALGSAPKAARPTPGDPAGKQNAGQQPAKPTAVASGNEAARESSVG